MTQPLISVIIPLYNKEQWVKRSVASVLTQTYVDIEILIVNDGSTDNSLQVVKTINDPRIKIFVKSNGGVSSARNLGLNKAQGEYIAFLDADDEWEAHHLEVLLEGFKNLKDAIVLCSDLVELSDNESNKNVRRKLPFDMDRSNKEKTQYLFIDDYLQTLADDYFILSASSVLIKASVIREHRLYFHEHMTHCEDVNFWIQLSRYGKFVFCDHLSVFYHRVDENSAMRRSKKEAALSPPCFEGMDHEQWPEGDLKKIQKFLRREYLKKAYQNRGLSLRNEELSSRFGGGIEIGRWVVLLYLSIRYTPEFVFDIYRKVKNSSRRKQ